MNDTIAEQAHRVTLEEAIHDHLTVRQWYRKHRWADWPDLRHQNEVELRALLKVARKARRIARDPYPPTMTYAGWTEGEMAATR